jgi:hypothetical protein
VTDKQHSQHVLYSILSQKISYYSTCKKIVYLVPYASYPGGTGDIDPP